MAQSVGRDDAECTRIEMSEKRRGTISASSIGQDDNLDEESALKWAAIERLPTIQRLKSSLFDVNIGNESDNKKKRVIDVTKIAALEKHMFIEKLIRHVEQDNLRLLQKIRKRLDKTSIELPTVEVKYNNLQVEAECEIVYGKPLPTLWNSFKSMLSDLARLPGLKSPKTKINILNGVCGIVKPGRMTLLMGPPGCGKTSLLKVLSGNLDKSLEITGDISYNGFKLREFAPQKTAAYISQYDMHIPEMTVRETLDFSARCQGIGNRAEIMTELSRREKEAGIHPDPDIDTYMKAISVEGQKATLQTDYILKILRLDICADTLVGDAMRRGISGGQKKRLTTGEMIVGPTRVLFMDEITNGLDSSTAYQIVSYLQQLTHITDATILISLLQPAPETFDLFDDIILMAGGKTVYHGPRSNVLEFFEGCGFKCPERKGVADFLQEVISEKDQAQYWYLSDETYIYKSVDMLSKEFEESRFGKRLNEELSRPFVRSEGHKDAITFSMYSIPKLALFKACMSREFLLMKRNSSIYAFKSAQVLIAAITTMTVFLRTQMDVDLLHANNYLGALFYGLIIILLDGFPELTLTVARLPVFYKQRDLHFYPAWAYAIPSAILKIPLSLLEAVVWTSFTYYVIGYSPEPGRFFVQLLVLFAAHLASISMFRFLASVFRTIVASTTAGSLTILFVQLFSGFIITRSKMPSWLSWGFWISPLTYGEIGVAVNEFLAPRWQKKLSSNTTIGRETLESRGLSFQGSLIWFSIGALFGFALLFNIGFTLALSFLNPPGSRAIVSSDKVCQIQENKKSNDKIRSENSRKSPHSTGVESRKGKMVLPFEPLTVVFEDLQYYIDTPLAMKERGSNQEKIQLLRDVTGTFRPGILTALMGVSGAGKTTLLDVLSGRKTSGTVEGEIRIGGFPKVQQTFARISGYCEQFDIHSPQITVEESLIFSAWLRLDAQINSETKSDFVKEVLEAIELHDIKDSLVGIPNVSGLSTEQRKRLTIAVELVANPSVIFLDEPTTGLDARAAAIVMRAVKNVADTGRTIVCTIHQPSIDIFEAFDELILLKSGGRMIYCGPLGQHSNEVIQYFESISGVPKIKNDHNPATWMLDITSKSSEAELGVDFAQIYKNSTLFEDNKLLVKRLSVPSPDSRVLNFPTRFSLNVWGQFKACLWKQFWSYWRSPSYNLSRFLFILLSSLIFGVLFWDQGDKINDQQGIFNILGSMYIAVVFCGISNTFSVSPKISMERTVLYRERFAGMYASWAYALAQVTIEIPYILGQTLVYSIITYPMIGYHWSGYKIFWYFYSMFCTLLYYTYMGMLTVSMTQSTHMAVIWQTTFNKMFNLFAGFLVPRPQIPKWWLWFCYLSPTSWPLYGMLTSQYGDIHKEIQVFGEAKPISTFLRDYYGYHYNQLPLVAVVLILYPIVIAVLFALCIAKLNFQKR
ncbi:hypothetical protein ACH5RR_022781 [Cinchona calisaya]|uniref:ABC transporter domain-containing protein n=1 Tax=Cinchona calisaya TaxID=153742 RepID=A0ABD2Z8T9_9GENT